MQHRRRGTWGLRKRPPELGDRSLVVTLRDERLPPENKGFGVRGIDLNGPPKFLDRSLVVTLRNERPPPQSKGVGVAGIKLHRLPKVLDGRCRVLLDVEEDLAPGYVGVVVQGQLLVPTLLAIEQLSQMAETDTPESPAHGALVETRGLGGIADRGTQRSERQVRALGHEHHGLSPGHSDAAGDPGPQAGKRAGQSALA